MWRLFAVRIAIICGLASALAPCIAKAQTSAGLVDLLYRTVNTNYVVDLYQNQTTQAGPGYAGMQLLTASNLDSPTLALACDNLWLFCVEVGQDTPGGVGTPANTPELYQILDANSLSYVDSTNLPVSPTDSTGTPQPQTGVAPFENVAGITATGGIGLYRASELELLYGYAFGNNGVLLGGTYPRCLSAVDQVAFQLAVWKLSHEGFPGSPAALFLVPTTSAPTGVVSATGFSVTGVDVSVIDEANSLLTAVQSDIGITPMDLDALNNGTYQDFLIPVSAFAEIPEPSTSGAILGLAAVVWALMRRRSCRTHSPLC